MVEVKKEIELSETLRAVSKRDNNPALIVADQLVQKGLAVRISDLDNLSPDLYADIHFSQASKSVFDRISETAEIRALSFATDSVTRPEDLINGYIDSCQWDPQTKAQVRALNWQQQAENHHRAAERVDNNIHYQNYTHNEKEREKKRFQEMASDEEDRAQKILGNSKPLTLADIISLISDVVEKEFSSR